MAGKERLDQPHGLHVNGAAVDVWGIDAALRQDGGSGFRAVRAQDVVPNIAREDRQLGMRMRAA